jgi:hypothetical protein
MEDFIGRIAEQYLTANSPVFLGPYIGFMVASAVVLYKTCQHGLPKAWSEAIIPTGAALVFFFCFFTVILGYQKARSYCQQDTVGFSRPGQSLEDMLKRARERSMERSQNNCDSPWMK